MMEENVDTIIVPAKFEGFNTVFLQQHRWWAVPMSSIRIREIKYLAVYQVAPISAITYYAKISRIEKYKNTERFIFYFEEAPIEIDPPITLDSGRKGLAPQAHRYTSLEKLLNSKKLSEV